MSDERDNVERLVRAVAAGVAASVPGVPITAIVNPAAGSPAVHRARIQANAAALKHHANVAVEIVWTEYPEHATRIVRELIARGEADSVITAGASGASSVRRIVLSFGGDGTHNEILRATVGYPDIAVLRLPYGSGNDSADVPTFAHLFEDTVGWQAGYADAVRVTTRLETLYAFNIASIGLDAFITDMHGRLKRVLPGDSYRMITNVAVLFYERLVGLQRMVVRAADGREAAGFIMLAAFGAGGRRTYGNHMHVLPGDENVCIMSHGGLRTKLRLKRLFMAGLHVNEPQATVWTTPSMTVEYDGSLPLQVDGEARRVGSEEFPVRFEHVRDAVRVLVPVYQSDARFHQRSTGNN